MNKITLPPALSMEEKKNLSSFATAWLLEMEAINNPQVKAALIANVFKVSDQIKDVEMLTDTNQQKMLIYLKLGWVGRTFKKRSICSDVLDMISQVLPSYEFRITLDRALFLKAVEGFKRSLTTSKVPRK